MISMKVNGFEEIKNKTKMMNERTKNMNTVLSVIAGKIWKNVMNNFKEEIGTEGYWQPWRKKIKDGGYRFYPYRPYGRGGDKLLQDTGRLRSSIRYTVFKDTAVVYTNIKYAKYHQEGTSNIPKRDFMWIPDSEITKYKLSLLKYIKG